MFWIILLVAVVVLFFVYRAFTKDETLENNATEVVKNVAEAVKTDVKNVLDVNKDGKVTTADVKEAGKKVKAGAKKAAGKAKSKLKVAK